MSKEIYNVGIMGCGNISREYCDILPTFSMLKITAVSDLDMDRARETAEKYGIDKACTVQDLMADEAVDIVLNLTIPSAHADITLMALDAGKHVYSEKPLAGKREDGKKIIERAKEKGLLVGAAPDTVLGGGIQTARKLIDDGVIGEPVAAHASVMNSGPESWHPNPGFFYLRGSGPLFDLGPYYLSALITLLGPVKRVAGSARITHKTRTATAPEVYGRILPVEVPTHVSMTLDFNSGIIGTFVASFDVKGHHVPCMEIYGSEGSIAVPDPNGFGGPVSVRHLKNDEWKDMPLTHGFREPCRGLGVADMACALMNNRSARANGDLAYHVLDIMHAVHESSDTSRHILLTSTCGKPESMLSTSTLQMIE